MLETQKYRIYPRETGLLHKTLARNRAISTSSTFTANEGEFAVVESNAWEASIYSHKPIVEMESCIMEVKLIGKRKFLVTIMLCSLFIGNSVINAFGSSPSQKEQQSAVATQQSKAPTTSSKQTAVIFPALKGPYKVGTDRFHWIDKARPETFTADKSDHRELMIQVWYPTNASSASYKREPYATDPTSLAKAYEGYSKVPAAQFLPLLSSTTHSLIKAPIAESEQKYPVLILSHGFGMLNDTYRFIAEPLASQGYIVVSVQHTYNSLVTTFPNGKVVKFNGANDDNTSYLDRLITKVWVKDIQFVLDHLAQLAEKKTYHIWKQADLSRVGMLGHSFGGATAAQVMLQDDRVKAGINMDGGFFGKLIPESGIPGPFMLMNAGYDGLKNLESTDPKQVAQAQGKDEKKMTEMLKHVISRYKQAVRSSYSVSFRHADHSTFSDTPLITYPSVPNDAARIQTVYRTHSSINAYTLDFFDYFLKGKPSKLLDGKNKIEDVKVEIGEHVKTKSASSK
ncbi:dienelactone hydrolase family protein [Paenibacillus sp. UMB4589-SE434]|uniref:alpha/beta hydrolase family protein n=1 Tax=Paenibacillus sp. UMB4589-SE434 TaxID=3046314 RepID=UPI00255197E8|nr:dienelactone hydrolase family protein [Paenibacillus sp. UMB4589-SE434]MDK8180040.1 dienelactone hydrolase family protein [Paenibacillus sp. UMB4589-SE434]